MKLIDKLVTKKKELLHTKFASDVMWTFAGRLSVALFGVILNVLIGNHYNAEGLGVFNQALALYLIFSLFSVFGVNNSVLKHIAEFKDDQDKLREVLNSSLLIVLGTASLLTLALVTVFTVAPGLVNKPLLVKAMRIILLSLPFFSLNRIFGAFLNGLRRMKLYSFIFPLRWGLITLFMTISIIAGKDMYFGIYSFLFSEFFILVYLVLLHRKYLGNSPGCIKKWWRVHFLFGSKTFFVNAINIVNQRLDILMVGYFITNEAAGLYSFAATAARGFFLIGAAIQRNFSPIVSNLWAKQEIKKIKEYFEEVKKNLFYLVSPLLILAGLAYPVMVDLLMNNPAYAGTWYIFLILLIGAGLVVILNWSGGMLTMANFLDESLAVSVSAVVTIIAGNVVLIPLIGIEGAAMSSTLSYIVRLLVTRHYVKQKMGIRLF
jgi:O-antigen/teichoic acid export membrane protein